MAARIANKDRTLALLHKASDKTNIGCLSGTYQKYTQLFSEHQGELNRYDWQSASALAPFETQQQFSC